MKKYLSFFLILFAIMATETSCETNGAEQEKSMTDWSPAGKMFINDDYSEERLKEMGVDYFVTVIQFVNENSVRVYSTPNKDLTYNSEFYKFLWEYTYSGEYPRFVLERKGETRILKFIDENSCYFASQSKWVYTYVSD